MKKGLLVLLSSLLLSTASFASDNMAKGLNVVITSLSDSKDFLNAVTPLFHYRNDILFFRLYCLRFYPI